MYLAGNLVFAALRRKDTGFYEEKPRRVSSEAFLQLVQVRESDGFLPELLAQPAILGGVSRVPFASRCPRTAASVHNTWISSKDPSSLNSLSSEWPPSRRSLPGISRSRIRRHRIQTTCWSGRRLPS